MNDLEYFYPDRMASRILGMGDVISLIEKVQSTIDKEESKKIQEKMLKQTFTFDDFLKQIGQVKKNGIYQRYYRNASWNEQIKRF